MNKMNMRKIRDTTKELKDENDLIERQYRSTICFKCSNPATHLLVRRFDFDPNYHESFICNMCSDRIKKLSDYEWDLNKIVGVYKLM